MYTYHTKLFSIKLYTEVTGIEEKIDEWLNGFNKSLPKAEYNYEIVGYQSMHHDLMITVRVWELKK